MTVLGAAPALPLHAAGKYVAGAYVVFVLVILIYVAIMAVRLTRMQRQLVELSHDVARQEEAGRGPDGERDLEPGREPVQVSAGGPAGDTPL
jgi:hypothetical protein